MATKEQSRELEAFWQHHLQTWSDSQQSQVAYCRSHDLNPHQFGYWKRKLLPCESAHQAPASGFVQVQQMTSPSSRLSLTLPTGPAAIVEQELEHNPFDGGLYAFTNRQRNKIKCLFWEDNGFVLYYKSLAEEKFKWPKPDEDLMSLTGKQINWLLDGYDIALMKGHKKLYYEESF